jgi:hypothetical protein
MRNQHPQTDVREQGHAPVLFHSRRSIRRLNGNFLHIAMRDLDECDCPLDALLQLGESATAEYLDCRKMYQLPIPSDPRQLSE